MNNMQKEQERNADLHLQLSEKYMAYKDLADRCLINPDHVGKYFLMNILSNEFYFKTEKGERRVFYMKPKSPFLQEPRVQN